MSMIKKVVIRLDIYVDPLNFDGCKLKNFLEDEGLDYNYEFSLEEIETTGLILERVTKEQEQEIKDIIIAGSGIIAAIKKYRDMISIDLRDAKTNIDNLIAYMKEAGELPR